MQDLLLDVQGLETQFKTPEGFVHAVNGVSIALKAGETLGVVGESGCGKTVTMLSVLRLIASPPGKITAGKAYFVGKDLLQMSKDEIRHVRGSQIAMIFQDPMCSLNPVLTIGAQMEEPLMLHLGMTRRVARLRAVELLEKVGIPRAKDRLPDFPHQFSGGMRQRVMIAMALSCDPKILIADEPTTALDVTIQAQIIELVKRLRDELKMAIIWITFGWMGYARIIRGDILAIKERDYVMAARVIGVKDGRILFRHILLNAIFPTLVLASLAIGEVVLSFAALSFLGIGTQIGYADWGQVLSFARNWIGNLSTFWYIVVWPGLTLVLFVMGWNLVGDALRDVLDPRMRGKT